MRVPPVCSDPGGSHPVGCGAPAPARPTASGNTDRGRHGPAATPALPTELGGVDACAQNGSLPERAPLTVAGHSQGRDGWGLPTDLQEQWGADGHMWVWFHTQSSRPSMRQHAEKKRERNRVRQVADKSNSARHSSPRDSLGEAPIHAVQAAQQRGPTRGTAESGEATRTTAPPAGCTIYQLWSIHPSPPLATGWAAGASTSGTGWRTSLRRRHPPVEGRAPLTWTPRDGACLGRPPSTLSGAHAAAVSWWGVYVLYPNRPPGGAWYGCPRPTAGTAAP